MLTPTKRTVRVTLDIECYDDLELETYDWNEVLGLEGDETVYATMEEVEIWWDDVPVRDPSTPSGVDFFMITGRQGEWRPGSSSSVPPLSSDFL